MSRSQDQPGLRQLPGAGLDVVTAAGRVGHEADVRFLQQQQLGVAGHPPGEGVDLAGGQGEVRP